MSSNHWFLAVALALVAGCSRNEGDVPLHVVNPLVCPAGAEPTRQIVVRIERGADYVQQGLDARMSAPNTWAGRKVTVKVGLCSPDSPCQTVSWLGHHETVIGGSDRGLSVEIPQVDVPCDGDQLATGPS